MNPENAQQERQPLRPAVLNHVGICVSDPDRSRRFYEGVFGYVLRDDMSVPDGVVSKLLQVSEPVGLTAQFLVLGDHVLELLHFEHHPGASVRRRFTEPGLTHLSFGVEDLDVAKDLVVAHGGAVLADTQVGGLAVLVRDPDGQLIELISAGDVRPFTDRADRA